jgi:hypothetical protein
MRLTGVALLAAALLALLALALVLVPNLDQIFEQVLAPLPVTGRAQHCQETSLAVLVPRDHAQGLLPPGFRAGEGAELFQSPLAGGHGAVTLHLSRCATNTIEEGPSSDLQLNVYIEPPDPSQPRAREFYEVLRITTGVRLAAGLEIVGWPVERAGLRLHVADAPGVLTATGASTDEEGDRYRLNASTPPAEATKERTRYWHVSDRGVARLDVAHEGAAQEGVAGCEVRRETPEARLIANGECGLANARAQVWPSMSLAFTFTFEMGVDFPLGDGRP